MNWILQLICIVLYFNSVNTAEEQVDIPCLCIVSPCDPVFILWCVKKWPHVYPSATCVPYGCCQSKWYRTERKVNEFVCPPRRDCPPSSPGTCADTCSDDSECAAAGQLCCANDCGKECVDPIKPICPPGTGPVKCFGDPCSVNLPHEKCKANFPDMTCVANYCGGCFATWYETSAKHKLLKCPQVCTDDARICPDSSVVKQNPYNNCNYHHPCPSCTKDARVCPDGTVVERDVKNNCKFFPCPTVIGCPLVPRLELLCEYPHKPEECVSDEDCKGKAKCCLDHCERKKCILSPPRSGKCPALDKNIQCFWQDDIRCGVDSECGGRKKCCATNCGGTACKGSVKGRR